MSMNSKLPDLNADGGKSAEAARRPTICSVCLEEVVEGGGRTIVKLQCMHEFHLDCIGSEFNMKRAMRCPNCRRVEAGDWRYAGGSNNPPLIEIDDDEPPMNAEEVNFLQRFQEHLAPRTAATNGGQFLNLDDFITYMLNQTIASAHAVANAFRRDVFNSSQGLSRSSAPHLLNAASNQMQNLNSEGFYAPIANNNPIQTLEPVYQAHSFNHIQIGNSTFVALPVITRGTLNGSQNHSAAYSSSSVQSGILVLDSDDNNSDHHSEAYYPYHQQNGNIDAVLVHAPEVNREMPNGPQNHSAAYSYFEQYGSLNAVSSEPPRTSRALHNSPNPTGRSSIHQFFQDYSSDDSRSAANSSVLSSPFASHPRAQEEHEYQDNRNMFQHEDSSRVMRQQGHIEGSGTAASTSRARRSPYNRPPTPYYRPPTPYHRPSTSSSRRPQTATMNTATDRRNRLQQLENAPVGQFAPAQNSTEGYHPQPTVNQRSNSNGRQNGRGNNQSYPSGSTEEGFWYNH